MTRSLAFAALSSLVLACSPSDEGASETPEEKARTRQELGPVALTVEIEPANPRLSDEPELTITIEAEAGVVIHKPPFGEAIGGFLIRDFRELLPTSEDGRQVIRLIYELEAMTTGEHTIAPIPVRFEDKRPDGDQNEHVIESEALIVEVLSMLEGEAPSLADLRGPEGLRELESEPVSLLWFVVPGAAILLGTAFLILWVRRRSQATPEKKLSPKELAWLELQTLIGKDLVGHDDLAGFYVELTGIVRRYVERTTGIRAPEQTTEEFLREMRRAGVFSGEEQEQLGAFLESADLVKFAAAHPGSGEIETSFEKAKAFCGLAVGRPHAEIAP